MKLERNLKIYIYICIHIYIYQISLYIYKRKNWNEICKTLGHSPHCFGCHPPFDTAGNEFPSVPRYLRALMSQWSLVIEPWAAEEKG